MTITKEGALTSFYTVNKAPIKHLRVYFSPKQTGSENPSPENIRPIEGWNNCKNYTSGKNLLDTTKNSQFEHPDFSFENGVVQTRWIGSGNSTKLYFTQIFSAGTYTISCKYSGEGNAGPRFICDKSIVGGTWNNSYQGYWKSFNNGACTFTLQEPSSIGLVFLVNNGHAGEPGKFYDIQLECGSIATIYEPYNGQMQIIDWSNDISTIYGGYVDLITGELVQTYTVEEPNERNFGFTSGYAYQWGHTPCNTSGTANYKKGISSHWTTSSYDNRNFVFLASSGAFWIGKDFFDSAGIEMTNEALLAYINQQKANGTPFQAGGPLVTPITYQLSPAQLQTFIGQNNIWSNADRVEVEYDLAESNDELYRRRNIILQSAPHLESASDNIANFNTDLIAPIKDAKIYFNPIQEGEGDPSLENIRPINGWTGLNINQTGKNLINPATNPIWKNGTYTVNNDGSVTISGSDGRGWTSEQITPFPLSKGTYTFSWTGSKRVQFATSENNYATVTTYTKNFTFTLNNDGYIKWKHTGDSGDYPETVYAQIEVGTIATSFEPYKGNTIPITFPTIGKNLLDITRTSKINPGVSTSTITIQDGTIAIDAVSGSARSYVMFEQIFPAGTYTIQAQNSGAVGTGVLLSTTEFNGSSYNSYYNAYRKAISSSDNTLTFTLTSASQIGLVLPNLTNESGNPGTLYDIQLEEGSIATAYEPYNNTIYGGYVDLIKGELVKTHELINLKAAGKYSGDDYAFWYTSGIQTLDITNDGVLCNKCQLNINTSGKETYNSFTWYNNGIIRWTEIDTMEMTTKDYNIYLDTNPLIATYKLKTPIIYQLTPQTLKTLKGVNNIWSDANGPIEVQYWTH